MSQSDKYRDIYNKEIICKGRGIVFSYEPFSDKFVFAPFSHNVGETAVEDLGELMRHNLFFYAFGENEVVKYYEDGMFATLQESATQIIFEKAIYGVPMDRGEECSEIYFIQIPSTRPNMKFCIINVRSLFDAGKNIVWNYNLT